MDAPAVPCTRATSFLVEQAPHFLYRKHRDGNRGWTGGLNETGPERQLQMRTSPPLEEPFPYRKWRAVTGKRRRRSVFLQGLLVAPSSASQMDCFVPNVHWGDEDEWRCLTRESPKSKETVPGIFQSTSPTFACLRGGPWCQSPLTAPSPMKEHAQWPKAKNVACPRHRAAIEQQLVEIGMCASSLLAVALLSP